MYTNAVEIAQKADNLVKTFGTRDPHTIADELDIHIKYADFKSQRGAYAVILRNRYVFLHPELDPVMENIVLWHEIGHDQLHRQEAINSGWLQEFNIFDMREDRMEYEANIFAAQGSLPDDEVLEYIFQGYDIQHIAQAMQSDINLVALKVDTLRTLGYDLRPQEHKSDFLKFDR